MRSLLVVLTLTACASPAFGQTPQSMPSTGQTARSAPQSVWLETEDGGLEHQQSGMLCPQTLGPFQRKAARVYDGVGLDVGCEYSAPGSAFQVYLTRRGVGSVSGALEEARQDLVRDGADRHPVHRGDEQVTQDGLTWSVARYSEDGGLLSEIRVAELSGWLVQHRITSTAAGEATGAQGVSAMTESLMASAAPRLALCAAAPAAVRDGRRITDTRKMKDDALMSAILGGALMGAAEEKPVRGRKAKKGDDVLVQPLVWCPEQVVTREVFRMLLWRGLFASGGDANRDRLTLVSKTRPPTLEIGVEGLAGLLREKEKGPPQWTATVSRGAQIMIYGYFEGRPSAEDATALFADILAGRTEAIGGYGADGGNITIIMPPD